MPIRWFALFTGAERRLLVHPDRRELVFTTPMVQARRRAARALERGRKGLGDVAVTAALDALAAGDGAAAGAAYDRVVARWRQAQLGACSN